MTRWSFLLLPVLLATCILMPSAIYAAGTLRAGAYAQDISPTKFPSAVNGSMKGGFAQAITDPMHARCVAIHDGAVEIILCVVDACMIPQDICDKAKEIASKRTGVPAGQIMISATHTHSAAALGPAFQSDPDMDYVATVPALIAEGLIKAHENLEPAEIAWGFGSDPSQVFNRRWRVKEQEQYENPFSVTTDRAWMNPGAQNPKVSVPAGPVDPDVGILAVRSAEDKRPLALLANYSLHYVGGNPAISADYFAAFAHEMAGRLKATDTRYQGKPAFVGIMSNGTSGDINNINFASPIRLKRQPGEQIKNVARSVADAAMGAYDNLKWSPTTMLGTSETVLQLGVRKADAAGLAQARQILETVPKDKDGQWADRKAIYARETVKLADYPDKVPVKLQAYRIGDLSIATIPCETFVEIGLDLKKSTPFTRHFTVSLANGYNGYLPTPEQHKLGGYETWRARSSYLEVDASTKIAEKLKSMLAELKAK
ncbi:hypothetical protein DES53_107201 [Roseimicrobium gellanilyticum]|uniref:Neutral/alkaline ceramidase-like enzyme n=1 Tax=Roseimicrobium gellanilyticum TaxID=748857 RepID=A0A366HH26_9BACT|nr:hypothetical protein [Roseimicrobium gellanilyticum]RBP41370.1 hypothetical protein DES53_107201 [Roseimicrobium gellanilyticum]